MNDNKTPINQQFAAIDALYWDMLQGNSYYAKIGDVSSMIYFEKDKKKLLDDIEHGITNGLDVNDIKQTADLNFDNAATGAQMSGEERGFILGFLYAAQMFNEINAGRALARCDALERLRKDIEAAYE